MKNAHKTFFFQKEYFLVSWIFADFLMLSVQEYLRNNKSIESALNAVYILEKHSSCFPV